MTRARVLAGFVLFALAAACSTERSTTPTIENQGGAAEGGAGGRGRGGAGGGAGAQGGNGGSRPVDAPVTDGGADGPTAQGDGPLGGGRPEVGACTTPPTTRKAMGQACSCHDECGSGNCVDGVCCSSACTGPCMACSLPGMMGTCSPVPNGLFPVVAGQCPQEPVGSCGFDGRCDGRGACRKFPDGTVCEAGKCQGAAVVGTKLCSAGTCKAGATTFCTPFGCDVSMNQCFAGCTSNAQCDGQPCKDGLCGKKPLGATCGSRLECESGFCADGVCCNLACSGACVSCNQPGKMGQCTPVAAGVDDPHKICRREAPETCGQSGVCNGQGACSKYAYGTICKAAACSGATLVPASVCNGQGACVAGAPRTCAPFICADSACRGSCVSNADCVAPNTCRNTSCGKKQLGAQCRMGAECESGNCVDGVCCDNACTGKCMNCALSFALGKCTNVPADVVDPRAGAGVTDPARVCLDQGASSCGNTGKCNGQGGCQTYANGTVCRGESCNPATNQYSIGTCRSGTCATSQRTCAPNRCNGNRCGQVCSNDDQCVPPNTCRNGSCGKRPNGETCAMNAECTSGVCAQGVCCATACSGSCMSCALSGSAGQCTPVPNGAPDPAGMCTDQKAASCKTDGICDGKGKCRLYGAGTICAAASCAAGTAKAASKCDGLGACVAGASTKCTPITVCNSQGSACETTCTQDNQCVAGTKCFNGKCGLLDNGRACVDGTDCKSGLCVDGVCCNGACGDGNNNDCLACSKEAGAAVDGTCGPRLNGVSCSDNNLCTQTDRCMSGVCQGTNQVTCAASDQCHDRGTCDPATGLCSNPSKADGASCTDGSACTRTDTCQGGVCVGGNAVTCTGAADQCREASACDPATGQCRQRAKDDGLACSDNDACTTKDECDNGRCVGRSPITCMPSDQCHDAGTCDPATGMCSNPAKDNGSPCEDGNKCTQTDTCQGGRCTSGQGITCAASDPQCQTGGTCNPATGQCEGGMPKMNGSACEDGNKCTTNDKCNNGMCSAGTQVTCSATACRNAGTCDPGTGQCSLGTPKDDGTLCNDSDACTQTDTCQSGSCVGGDPVTCSGSVCREAGTCDKATGACSLGTPKPAGTMCNDNNACTQRDECSGGNCVGMDPKPCAGASTCRNAETCDTTTGTCLQGGPRNEGSNCEDGLGCTMGDKCEAGVCKSGAAQCAPMACKAGSCTANGCMYTDLADGTSCSDGNMCFSDNKCMGGMCVGVTEKTCNDNNPCTADSCDAATGCKFTPLSSGACDDGNACTTGESCQAGECKGGQQMACDDNNPCTSDSCNAGGMCVHSPLSNGSSCSDGNACTSPDTCQNGMCQAGTPQTCDDNNACTADSCDTATGCKNDPAPRNGMTCDDNKTCTSTDVCTDGTCAGTPMMPCP